MRWKKGRRSLNIEDRRFPNLNTTTLATGGGIGAAAIAVAAVMFDGDSDNAVQNSQDIAAIESTAAEDTLADFASAILADTEDTWIPVFAKAGREYTPPKLVLYKDKTESACGEASNSAGPFYCPADQKVYLDLDFYQQLSTRFNAPGDFAKAYVIAHEVGHHVQTQLGITQQVHRAKANANEEQANDLQVRLELQADCLSGVWANHAHRFRNLLEDGDIAEGLNAAAAIGDDTMQNRRQGYIIRETFTHGSAEQRQKWFLRGLKSGSISNCDTFTGDL